MTIRDQIMDAIEARFQLIQVGYDFTVNGAVIPCQTNVGSYVFKRRVVPMDSKETEMLVFVDTESKPSAVAGGYTQFELLVEIGCQVRGGDDPLGDATKRAADVLAAIGEDPSWGGLAEGSRLVDADLDFHVVGKVLAGFAVPIRITYQAPNWTL